MSSRTRSSWGNNLSPSSIGCPTGQMSRQPVQHCGCHHIVTGWPSTRYGLSSSSPLPSLLLLVKPATLWHSSLYVSIPGFNQSNLENPLEKSHFVLYASSQTTFTTWLQPCQSSKFQAKSPIYCEYFSYFLVKETFPSWKQQMHSCIILEWLSFFVSSLSRHLISVSCDIPG